MTDATKIQWTDATWNPVRGCSRVSPGCEHCYAEGVAARFSGPGQPYEGLAHFSEARRLPQWTGDVRLVPGALDQPLRWKRPRRIFVNSMADLFHERLANEEIAAIFGVMAAAPQHTFQVLTKRAERMQRWFDWLAGESERQERSGDFLAQQLAWRILRERFPLHHIKGTIKSYPWPLANVWLGVSVEDQARACARIPHLLATPAAVRFVSYEPALGHVDFTHIDDSLTELDALRGCGSARGLDWVIVGGESGPRARPFDVSWATDVVKQCKEARVACFVKQLGARPVRMGEPTGNFRTHNGRRQMEIAAELLALRHRKGGDPSEWPEDIRVREWPS